MSEFDNISRTLAVSVIVLSFLFSIRILISIIFTSIYSYNVKYDDDNECHIASQTCLSWRLILIDVNIIILFGELI